MDAQELKAKYGDPLVIEFNNESDKTLTDFVLFDGANTELAMGEVIHTVVGEYHMINSNSEPCPMILRQEFIGDAGVPLSTQVKNMPYTLPYGGAWTIDTCQSPVTYLIKQYIWNN